MVEFRANSTFNFFSHFFSPIFLRSRTRVKSRYLPAQHPGGLVQFPPFARPHFFFGSVDNQPFCTRQFRRERKVEKKSESRVGGESVPSGRLGNEGKPGESATDLPSWAALLNRAACGRIETIVED